MTRNAKSLTRILAPALALGLALSPSPPVLAQDGGFDGELVIGFRSVDVNGEANKFREDLNLDDGPRLMELEFSLTPEGTVRAFADRIQLDVREYGGEPFETLRLSVEKFGRYDFEWNRTESDYFYHDQLFPLDQVSVRNARAGDFHTFDFERVRDRANLEVTLSPRAELTFGFDRYAKRGESTTTLDIQRDEFELDRPIEEDFFQYQAAFEYSWDKVTVTLDERYSEYDNAYSIFLPGQSQGENPTDASVVDFFFLDQPYDFETWDHTLRVVAKPTDRWIIRGSGTLQDLSMDLNASERSQGTGFSGAPFSTDLVGSGDIDRDADLFDLDVTYVINDRFALVGGYYVRNLDQEGAFTFGGSLNEGVWEIETDGFEAGLEWTASSTLVLTGGVRYESRDVTHGAEEGAAGAPLDLERETTDHDGYFATVAWRPTGDLRFTLDYEDDSFDDPFTLASATDRSRVRATGRYSLDNGFWLSGSYLLTEYENDVSGWDAQTDQANLRLGYRDDRLSASVGYSMAEFDRAIAHEVVGSFGPPAFFAIDYTAESDFIDGMLRWSATPALTLGGELRLYENDGSFALERDDYRVFGEYRYESGFLYRLSYRTVDYDESAFDFDDYDADLFDFGVGWSW